MLPPARSPVPFASGDLRGLGCEGDQRFSAWWCRLCPRASRLGFPGGVVEAAATAAPWNKVLQPRPRLGGVSSSVGEGFVRVASTGLWCFAAVEPSSSHGGSSCGDGCSALHLGMIRVPVDRCGWTEFGFVVVRWTDSCLGCPVYRREIWIRGQGSSGCVPGRCAFLGSFCCGSLQSLWAMGLPLVLELQSFSSEAGALDGGGGRRRRRRRSWTCAKVPQGVVVFSLFCRGFCAKCIGQLSFCILPDGARICTVSVYVFLT